MISPHNRALANKLRAVAVHIEMAIEDAEEDFGSGLTHAEAALYLLRNIVAAGHSRHAKS